MVVGTIVVEFDCDVCFIDGVSHGDRPDMGYALPEGKAFRRSEQSESVWIERRATDVHRLLGRPRAKPRIGRK